MKKKVLKEFIQDGFSLAELDSIGGTYDKRIYCEKYLGDNIGKGRARIVYEIGDGEILKLARTFNLKDGINQNKQEYANYIFTKEKYPQINDIFPKVFQIASDGTWITCERVLPFLKKDSEEVLNLPYETESGPSLMGFIRWAETKTSQSEDVTSYAESMFYEDLMGKKVWFKEVYKYVALSHTCLTDLFCDNFGLALRNGKPCVVILDNADEKLSENMKNIDNIITESINIFLKENVESEYLDKQFGIPLKKYLNMSDKDKAYERIWNNPRLAYKFLENELGSFEQEDDEEMPFTYDDLSELDEDDGDSLYNFINDRLGEEGIEECGQYMQSHSFNSSYQDVTCDVMEYTKDIHNQWLIHFSDNAAYIADDGFQYATDEMNDLGYSNAGQIKGKSDEGWDFAYLANSVPCDGDKYGKEAVMFRASGIQAYHYGDQEEQVMFWNKDAKDIVYIENEDSSNCYVQNSHGDYVEKWYITSRITGEVLYDNDNIENVIAWVENNFDQYRKHLISKKTSKIRNKSLSNSDLNYNYKIK